jgi:hypothetical protein
MSKYAMRLGRRLASNEPIELWRARTGGCEWIMQTRIGGSALALGQRGDRFQKDDLRAAVFLLHVQGHQPTHYTSHWPKKEACGCNCSRNRNTCYCSESACQ